MIIAMRLSLASLSGLRISESSRNCGLVLCGRQYCSRPRSCSRNGRAEPREQKSKLFESFVIALLARHLLCEQPACEDIDELFGYRPLFG
jgi:hypothetical protein